ncbi:hypothetical protein BX600DRAFT_434804 [Xylariales sp. PMI_506]|nr:hypothetical protein BX600DRAFT_434804 [Xylariales sp. PMI_506]
MYVSACAQLSGGSHTVIKTSWRAGSTAVQLPAFIDNVIVLALEDCLIMELPSIFTTDIANRMDDDMLRSLAAESASNQLDRAEMQRDYDTLKRGLRLLNRYRERKATAPTSTKEEAQGSRGSTVAKASNGASLVNYGHKVTWVHGNKVNKAKSLPSYPPILVVVHEPLPNIFGASASLGSNGQTISPSSGGLFGTSVASNTSPQPGPAASGSGLFTFPETSSSKPTAQVGGLFGRAINSNGSLFGSPSSGSSSSPIAN